MRCHARVAVSCGVVLALSGVGCGGNGELFDEVVITNAEGPSAEPEPAPAEPAAPIVEPPPSGAAAPGEEPLGGEAPPLIPPPEPPPSAPPAELPPEPEPPIASGPEIISVSPEDGARGVTNDAPIVLRFSEPMDRPSTEAAYQSELVPSRSVSFAWNESSTELTISADTPLAYGVGSSPELAEARRISFFISASASSAAGEPLERPYEFSFSLLRRVELVVPVLADRAMSGNYRSNDSYGTGACAEGEPNMCVGDVRVGRQSQQYKGFISFELGVPLPDDARELSAQLSIQLSDTSGNPFAGLGDLLLDHVRFAQIGLDAFEAEPLDALGPIASAGAAGAELRADVTVSVLADLLAPAGLSQYRLAFEDATDADVASDAIISALETQRLEVGYLVP